ncbi:unnamed protein product, partial [Ectocarpus sp. 6 AP-2014]
GDTASSSISTRWLLNPMMQRVVLLLLQVVPSAGLLVSWTAARSRVSQKVQRSCTSVDSHTPGGGLSGDDPRDAMVSELLQLFQGEFDNYDQVVADRKAGMTPGPGGGHEHIHCSLKRLDPAEVPEQVAAAAAASPGSRSSSGEEEEEEEEGAGQGVQQQQPEQPLAVVAAKYYFNGDSNVVFRYRLYSFHACPPNTPGAKGEAVMRLWRLLPDVEARLRANTYDLTSFSWSDDDRDQSEPRRGSDNASSERCSKEGRTGDDVVERIFGCDIYWGRHQARGEDEKAMPGGISRPGKQDTNGGAVPERGAGEDAA